MSGGTPRELVLQSLQDFLREDVQPQLSGFSAYGNRVAANLLGILLREESIGPQMAALDEAFARQHGLAADVELPARLARALRDGELRAEATVLDYLRQRALLQLAIDNPRYAGYQMARARWGREEGA